MRCANQFEYQTLMSTHMSTWFEKKIFKISYLAFLQNFGHKDKHHIIMSIFCPNQNSSLVLNKLSSPGEFETPSFMAGHCAYRTHARHPSLTTR